MEGGRPSGPSASGKLRIYHKSIWGTMYRYDVLFCPYIVQYLICILQQFFCKIYMLGSLHDD